MDSLVLVQRAQGGDLEANNLLFARYYQRVLRIVRARLGPRLRASMESVDIVQETFLAAVQGFDRFEVREEASLINWLARIAENRIRAAATRLDTIKRDRGQEVALDHLNSSIHRGALVPEPVDRLKLPDEIAVDAEQVELIERAMDGMRAEYREVIILRDFAGGSHEDVALIMKRPSALAARMLHNRAVIELATQLRRLSRD